MVGLGVSGVEHALYFEFSASQVLSVTLTMSDYESRRKAYCNFPNFNKTVDFKTDKYEKNVQMIKNNDELE